MGLCEQRLQASATVQAKRLLLCSDAAALHTRAKLSAEPAVRCVSSTFPSALPFHIISLYSSPRPVNMFLVSICSQKMALSNEPTCAEPVQILSLSSGLARPVGVSHTSVVTTLFLAAGMGSRPKSCNFARAVVTFRALLPKRKRAKSNSAELILLFFTFFFFFAIQPRQEALLDCWAG